MGGQHKEQIRERGSGGTCHRMTTMANTINYVMQGVNKEFYDEDNVKTITLSADGDSVSLSPARLGALTGMGRDELDGKLETGDSDNCLIMASFHMHDMAHPQVVLLDGDLKEAYALSARRDFEVPPTFYGKAEAVAGGMKEGLADIGTKRGNMVATLTAGVNREFEANKLGGQDSRVCMSARVVSLQMLNEHPDRLSDSLKEKMAVFLKTEKDYEINRQFMPSREHDPEGRSKLSPRMDYVANGHAVASLKEDSRAILGEVRETYNGIYDTVAEDGGEKGERFYIAGDLNVYNENGVDPMGRSMREAGSPVREDRIIKAYDGAIRDYTIANMTADGIDNKVMLGELKSKGFSGVLGSYKVESTLARNFPRIDITMENFAPALEQTLADAGKMMTGDSVATCREALDNRGSHTVGELKEVFCDAFRKSSFPEDTKETIINLIISGEIVDRVKVDAVATGTTTTDGTAAGGTAVPVTNDGSGAPARKGLSQEERDKIKETRLEYIKKNSIYRRMTPERNSFAAINTLIYTCDHIGESRSLLTGKATDETRPINGADVLMACVRVLNSNLPESVILTLLYTVLDKLSTPLDQEKMTKDERAQAGRELARDFINAFREIPTAIDGANLFTVDGKGFDGLYNLDELEAGRTTRDKDDEEPFEARLDGIPDATVDGTETREDGREDGTGTPVDGTDATGNDNDGVDGNSHADGTGDKTVDDAVDETIMDRTVDDAVDKAMDEDRPDMGSNDINGKDASDNDVDGRDDASLADTVDPPADVDADTAFDDGLDINDPFGLEADARDSGNDPASGDANDTPDGSPVDRENEEAIATDDVDPGNGGDDPVEDEGDEAGIGQDGVDSGEDRDARDGKDEVNDDRTDEDRPDEDRVDEDGANDGRVDEDGQESPETASRDEDTLPEGFMPDYAAYDGLADEGDDYGQDFEDHYNEIHGQGIDDEEQRRQAGGGGAAATDGANGPGDGGVDSREAGARTDTGDNGGEVGMDLDHEEKTGEAIATETHSGILTEETRNSDVAGGEDPMETVDAPQKEESTFREDVGEWLGNIFANATESDGQDGNTPGERLVDTEKIKGGIKEDESESIKEKIDDICDAFRDMVMDALGQGMGMDAVETGIQAMVDEICGLTDTILGTVEVNGGKYTDGLIGTDMLKDDGMPDEIQDKIDSIAYANNRDIVVTDANDNIYTIKPLDSDSLMESNMELVDYCMDFVDFLSDIVLNSGVTEVSSDRVEDILDYADTLNDMGLGYDTIRDVMGTLEGLGTSDGVDYGYLDSADSFADMLSQSMENGLIGDDLSERIFQETGFDEPWQVANEFTDTFQSDTSTADDLDTGLENANDSVSGDVDDTLDQMENDPADDGQDYTDYLDSLDGLDLG